MRIIRETIRKVAAINGYGGVCDGCGSPLDYEDDLIVIEVANLEDRFVLCPADRLVGPGCNRELSILNLYKSTEVSGEFARLTAGK